MNNGNDAPPSETQPLLLNSRQGLDVRHSFVLTTPIIQHHNHNHNHHHHNDTAALDPNSSSISTESEEDHEFNRIKKKTWSFHGKSLHSGIVDTNTVETTALRSEAKTATFQEGGYDNNNNFHTLSSFRQKTTESTRSSGWSALSDIGGVPTNTSTGLQKYLYYIVYAIVNAIIAIPGFYGYAAVIFSHNAYQGHMNALCKLVVFSSSIHQMSFCLFSSLPFAIGTVQDAGLIFLSAMSNTIAVRILDEGGTEEQVLSTALVLLPLGTAALGIMLMILGYFRLADAVSYLPMPVVGGYLAFIGYFCLIAGVGLCVSENMTEFSDWAYLLDPQKLKLAAPGLISGLLLTLIGRLIKNDAALPLAMVLIPGAFYAGMFIFNISMDEARESGWIGAVSPPVPVKDLFTLVDFSLVRWDLIFDILPTWVGMVFVVSFASCLDVAAISMDMGEALDTNKELMTVGAGNLMSGMTFGYTGSYIFSQTLFTYRTGVHSRLIGMLLMMIMIYVVVSPVNVLEISPLFFLGSTLIFIGCDLLYEWLVEIREKIFLSEYFIVLGTFVAIQLVGMDEGIVIGVLFAIVEHVVHTATKTGVYRISKQSRANWSVDEYKIIVGQAYDQQSPQIVALEVVGSVFFGSALYILQRITDEAGIEMKPDKQDQSVGSDDLRDEATHLPHHSFLVSDRMESSLSVRKVKRKHDVKRLPAKFVVLDLTKVTNVDASAARGCFLQLLKIAQKRGIVICVCGTSIRIEWMLRSHHVAFELDEEDLVKEQFAIQNPEAKAERILLFMTIHEALNFCEKALVMRMGKNNRTLSEKFLSRLLHEERQTLSAAFGRILGSSSEEMKTLKLFDGMRYHSEVDYEPGQEIFVKRSQSDGFCIVLHGAVAVAISQDDPRHQVYRKNTSIVSGAGPVKQQRSQSNLIESAMREDDEVVVASVWPVGGVFGYVDFLLDRPRNFTAVATQEGTVVAKLTSDQIRLLQSENSVLDLCLQRVLLKASLMDLANCTCDE